jgi:hypothetical protein
MSNKSRPDDDKMQKLYKEVLRIKFVFEDDDWLHFSSCKLFIFFV